MNDPNPVQLVNEKDVARTLGVSVHCVRHWRAHGGGPPWLRLGERLVRYDLAALRAWIEERAAVSCRAGE